MDQVGPVSKATQSQLDPNVELRNRLGHATVKWIKEITEGSNASLQGYRKDKSFLQKNMWCGSDLLEACQKRKQPAMVEFLMNHHKLFSGYAPHKFFSTIPDTSTNNFTGNRIMHLVAKKDVLPDEALKAAVAGLTIGDNGMACQIARYGALLDILEREKFNRLFGKEHGQPMNIGYLIDDELQPMRYFVDFTFEAKNQKGGEINNRPIEIGQLVLIKGVTTYHLKKPFGKWQSRNVVCYNNTPGEQRFGGLGLKDGGETEVEINKRLCNGYNRDEDPFAILSDKLQWIIPSIKEQVPQVITLKNDKANVVEGYAVDSPQDFIIELINDLIKLPLDEISMAYVKNHRVNKGRFSIMDLLVNNGCF